MAKTIIIAALADNRVIGCGGLIPWHLPEDFRHFRETTTGHAVIMGGKTYRSLGRALPNRRNFVVSRSTASLPDAVVAVNLPEALSIAGMWADALKRDVYIIGGGEIYHEAMSVVDELVLSHVKGQFTGDTFFPHYADEWSVSSEDDRGEFVIRRWIRKN